MPSKHVVTGSNPVGRAIISDPSKANLLGFFIVSPKPSIVVVIALNFVALGGVLFVIIHHYHHQAVRPLVFFYIPYLQSHQVVQGSACSGKGKSQLDIAILPYYPIFQLLIRIFSRLGIFVTTNLLD